MPEHDPTSQADALNSIQSAGIAFGDVTAANKTLLALGTSRVYNHLLFSNSLNQDVIITIGSEELLFPANESRTYDGVVVNGNILIKHNGVAPASGNLYLNAW